MLNPSNRTSKLLLLLSVLVIIFFVSSVFFTFSLQSQVEEKKKTLGNNDIEKLLKFLEENGVQPQDQAQAIGNNMLKQMQQIKNQGGAKKIENQGDEKKVDTDEHIPEIPNPEVKAEIWAPVVEGVKQKVTWADVAASPSQRVPFYVDWAKPEGKLCLRRWQPDNVIAWVHIGKTGGTSMDQLLNSKFDWVNGCHGCRKLPHMEINAYLDTVREIRDYPGEECPACMFVGLPDKIKHHDFYMLNHIMAEDSSLAANLAPISWLREPASRMQSQFFFSKQIRVLPKEYSLEDYVWRLTLNPTYQKGANELFSDGANAVMWFSGNTPGGWINKGLWDADLDYRKQEFTRMQQFIMNEPEQMLKDALTNFHRSLWVGLLEQADESIELLNFQLGSKLSHFPHSNTGKTAKTEPKANEPELEMLRRACPLDSAFYSYVREIHSARLALYARAKAANMLEEVTCKTYEESLSFRMPLYFNGSRVW